MEAGTKKGIRLPRFQLWRPWGRVAAATTHTRQRRCGAWNRRRRGAPPSCRFGPREGLTGDAGRAVHGQRTDARHATAAGAGGRRASARVAACAAAATAAADGFAPGLFRAVLFQGGFVCVFTHALGVNDSPNPVGAAGNEANPARISATHTHTHTHTRARAHTCTIRIGSAWMNGKKQTTRPVPYLSRHVHAPRTAK